MMGVDIHSHPIEIPPTFLDLRYLLLGDFAIMGDFVITAEAAVFVATPRRNIVIFRGRGAPQFTHKQVNEKIEFWENLFEKRLIQSTKNWFKQHRAYMTDTQIIEELNNMPELEKLDFQNRERGILLSQIAEKYKLRIFSGDANNTTVKLLWFHTSGVI